MRFTHQSLFDIIKYIREQLPQEHKNKIVSFEVVNPDVVTGVFSGEKIQIDGVECIYRSYKSWLDLAEVFDLGFRTPISVDESFVVLSFTCLDTSDSWHKNQKAVSDRTEKYGADSGFSRIDKTEEPGFLWDYLQCLERVSIRENESILDLGVNRGDEFAVFKKYYSNQFISSLSFTGVDHSESAVAVAQQEFPQSNYRFIEGDINCLSELELEQYDLVLSIGTLQSPGVNSDQVLRDLVQRYMRKGARMILGFPNCRYAAGRIKYGAKVKNYSHPEMSLVMKDINFYKKYLQQHKFKVTITGKYYFFLTAVPIRQAGS